MLRDRINGGTLDLVDVLNRSVILREGFSQGWTQADPFFGAACRNIPGMNRKRFSVVPNRPVIAILLPKAFRL